MPAISVVICTHNRAHLLTDVLRTVCEQTLDRTLYEVIVVDNNSKDNTRAVAEEFCRNYPHMRYHFETRQGLSHARNRGWQVAQGKYVAYIDDDCLVPEQWLVIAKEIADQALPAVFGGPFFAFYHTPKPSWYKDDYGSYELGSEAKILTQGFFVFGGNMFWRRALLQDLGGFHTDYGMSGTKLSYGEEILPQLFIRATMPDQVIYYDPRLYVYHLVRPEKLTMRWVMRERFARGRDTYRLFHNKISPAAARGHLYMMMVKTLLGFSKDCTLGVLKRNREQYPYIKNYLWEHTSRYVVNLGELYGQYYQVATQPKSDIISTE